MGLSFSQETQRWVMHLRNAVTEGRYEDIQDAIAQVRADSKGDRHELAEHFARALIPAAVAAEYVAKERKANQEPELP